ncbi:MAG: glycosyltransferase family 4 protein [Prevotella sp.]|nr:glycosyltransferase family 4 protein [Prevotella sp.]
MKILLLGEYSNVHATLAEGLKALGHEVTVVSNGDFWKDYPRDIDLSRRYTKWGGIQYLAKVYSLLPKFRGYDIVQLINPMFLELKANRIFPIFDYLKKHNKKVILGAFGMDHYWVNTCTNIKPLRYSDFNIGEKTRTDEPAVREQKDWIGTDKERLNKHIANECHAIVAGLYEYQVCYEMFFPRKTTFIPFPIKGEFKKNDEKPSPQPSRIKMFIGISKGRSEYKGTDIMLRAARRVQSKHPDLVQLQVAEGIPYNQYKEMMEGSDLILDQLYSYTPSMNPLLAMSEGIICVGGGEPENYEIIHEDTLRPIINVLPNEESVFNALEEIVLHRERIPELKRQSIEYVRKHHDYIKVARQYENLYQGYNNQY